VNSRLAARGCYSGGIMGRSAIRPPGFIRKW
jgi:hypothetical protein